MKWAVVCQAFQAIYERTYGARAKKGQYWNPTDSLALCYVLVHQMNFPAFLYPQDRQRIQRYKTFLDILEVRLVQMNETSVPKEPTGGWHALWNEF